MPNRILREGILTSDRVNALDSNSELFYRRLMSVVDDYGRYDARPIMLKVACYPLRVDVVREADISRWIAICEKAGLLALYAVNGKQYLELTDFNQQVRAKRSKFPCAADAKQASSACVAHAPVVGVGGVVEDEREAKAVAALPDWLHAELWQQFKDARRALKAKMTPHAEQLLISKLTKLRDAGQDAQAVIEQSIERGWKGLFPVEALKVIDGGGNAGWWSSEAGTLAKAKEIGLTCRGGESWYDFRGRIREAIAGRAA